MTIDTQKLRAAAQRVISESGDGWYDADQMSDPVGLGLPKTDALFIEVASPTAVIALLDQIGAMTAMISALRANAEFGIQERDFLAAEITRLRADRDSWAEQASARVSDWDEMRADRDRLREALIDQRQQAAVLASKTSSEERS